MHTGKIKQDKNSSCSVQKNNICTMVFINKTSSSYFCFHCIVCQRIRINGSFSFVKDGDGQLTAKNTNFYFKNFHIGGTVSWGTAK